MSDSYLILNEDYIITDFNTTFLNTFNLKDESLREIKLLSKIYFNEKLEKEYKLEELW